MMDSVSIKNHKYGILVRLDPSVSFEEITAELTRKFTESKTFFEGASLTLQFAGRKLTSQEEDRLTEIIEKTSGIHIICLFVSDEERGEIYLRARQKYEETAGREQLMKRTVSVQKNISRTIGFRVYPGNILNGETFRTRDNIIVLGKVEEGATLISARSVIVLNGIYGAVYAGDGISQSENFIASSDLSARKLILNGKRYLPSDRGRKFFGAPKTHPGFIVNENGMIVLKPLENDQLSGLTDKEHQIFLPLIIPSDSQKNEEDEES